MRYDFVEEEIFAAEYDGFIGSVDPGGEDAAIEEVDEMVEFVVDASMEVENGDACRLKAVEEAIVLRDFGKDHEGAFVFEAFDDIGVDAWGSAEVGRGVEQEMGVRSFEWSEEAIYFAKPDEGGHGDQFESYFESGRGIVHCCG